MQEVKVPVLSAKRAGKSGIVVRYMHNAFVDHFDCGIEDYNIKVIHINETPYMLDIEDTSSVYGHSPHAPWIEDRYYISLLETGHVFVLLYSITSRASFDELKTLLKCIQKAKHNKRVPLVLVGAKCDLENQREVSQEDGRVLAEQLGCPFLECSAKTGQNVDKVFTTALTQFLEFPESKDSCIIT